MTETRVKSKKTNPLQFIKRNYIRCHTCIEDSSMFYHRKKNRVYLYHDISYVHRYGWFCVVLIGQWDTVSVLSGVLCPDNIIWPHKRGPGRCNGSHWLSRNHLCPTITPEKCHRCVYSNFLRALTGRVYF